jgi:hypothetical protein
MIEKWESDLYEDPRDAIAAAADAQAILAAEGYKVGEIFWDYYIMYDDAGVGTIAGKQAFFYFGMHEDTLPGEEETSWGKTIAFVAGAAAVVLFVSVGAYGVYKALK